MQEEIPKTRRNADVWQLRGDNKMTEHTDTKLMAQCQIISNDRPVSSSKRNENFMHAIKGEQHNLDTTCDLAATCYPLPAGPTESQENQKKPTNVKRVCADVEDEKLVYTMSDAMGEN